MNISIPYADQHLAQVDYPKFTLEKQLSSQQIDFFEEHGFLHFKNFVDSSFAKTLWSSIQEVHQSWVDSGLEQIYGVPIKYGFDIDGKKIVQRSPFTSLYNPKLSEFLKEPRLQALYQLMNEPNGRVGEDEKDGLVCNHYVNTENSGYTRLGWHTDCLRDLFLNKKIGPMLNVGLHLNDFASENGGLKLIPGTHKQNKLSLLFRKAYFIGHKPDKNEVGLDVNAGDLTVHDGRLWHRVAKCPLQGEASRRRVMYIPIVGGEYRPKNEQSKTPFYHRFTKYLR